MKKYLLIPAWIGWLVMLSILSEYIINRPVNGWLQLLSILIVLGTMVGLLKYTAEFSQKNKKEKTND